MSGRTLLVQGGGGAVGLGAVRLAYRAGAIVVATVRSLEDERAAHAADAHHVIQGGEGLGDGVRSAAPSGVDHLVEVDFATNIAPDVEMLGLGGSIATYATNVPSPTIPFWPMVLNNVGLSFVGSDDVPEHANAEAACPLNAALAAGWDGFSLAAVVPLADIAKRMNSWSAATHMAA